VTVPRAILTLLVALAMVIHGAHAQDTPHGITRITLHPFARVATDAPIRIADVATIDGPLAAALGEVVLDEPGHDDIASRGWWTHLDAQRVREAAQSVPGLRAQDLLISGDACDVRRVDPEARLRAMQTMQRSARSADRSPAAALLPHTTHAGIVASIARTLGVGVGDVRVEIEPGDAERISASTVGRTLTVQPIGSGERPALRVTLYEGDAIVLREVVRARVEVKREVAVTREPIPRGQIIDERSVLHETRWLPADFRYTSPDSVPGAVARRALDVGEPIDAGAIEPPLAAKRGELISVHALTGGVVVESIARAKRDGCEGDIIELESVGAGEKRTFQARLAGRGRAVLIVGASTDSSSNAGAPAAHASDATLTEGGLTVVRSTGEASRRD
jgi:flagella basal body P-ring formation protein FlgA